MTPLIKAFSQTAIYLSIALSTFTVLAIDVATPLGLAVWIFYLLPVALALFTWHPNTPIMVALVVTGLMIITFFTDPPGVNREIAQINRAFGIGAFWLFALFGCFYIRNKLTVRRQQWLRVTQTELSEALIGDNSLEKLGEATLAFLVKNVGALAGAMYTEDGGYYRRIATYGVPEGGAKERFTMADGLLGLAAKENRLQKITNVPEGYLTYGSAFGKSKPSYLLVVPTAAEGAVRAVIELGFPHSAGEEIIELLNRVSEPIGVAIRSAHYRTNLQNLLEETQRQSEELQAQSEELRVSNEELEEQSRALQESQSRLEQQQTELEQTNAQLEEQTLLLENQRDDLTRAQADLQVRSRDLEQASQYKSDFLANMSHELRTPLNSSLILAKLLADNPESNLTEEQVQYARTIQSSGNDLLVLINDILDLSKIEAGHMEIRPEELEVSAIEHDLARTFEPLAAQKGIKFTIQTLPGMSARIVSDSKRLEQILKNLLSNAIKFTDQGEVSLRIGRAENGGVAFAVNDTGIGIDRDKHRVIFEAFRQADGTTNRKYGGTGLGLSISRELARLLGGEITLESELGKGSTFTLIIPELYDAQKVQARMAPASAPLLPSEPSPAKPAASPKLRSSVPDDRKHLQANGRIILVVEDDSNFAKILSDLAHEQQFQCLIAQTAEDALDLAVQYLPQAVILDVGLPDNSGLSVLDRLKQDVRTRHIPVHVVSANDYSDTAFSLGAVGYMLKPVKHEELLDVMKKMERTITQRMRRVLVVEDDPVQRDSVAKLLGSKDVEIIGVGTAAECLNLLKEQIFDCMVLDLSLPDASGYSLLETLSKKDAYSFPPVIVYTGRDLSSEDEQKLRRYSKSIIIKGAKSPERLLDEVTLFLHHVVSELPVEQQRLLKKAKNRDAILEGRRILVVEDDIRNVYALTSILEPRGAIVQIARNGREGIDAIEKAQEDSAKKIDLILMDVMMPEMDGIMATREIRKRSEWKKIPIIMLTAKAMKNDQENCLDAGANDYMAKPLDVEKLLSLVRVWLPR